MPSYVVALAFVVVLQFALRVGTGPGFRVDVLYALGFAENWRAVLSERDIAQIFVSPSPVQHLWSVSLLVQLIVLVPLGFAGLMRLVGKRWRVAGAVVAAVAAGSFLLAKLTAEADGNGGLAYFGTQNRAGEFLVGTVLAFAVLSGAVRRVLESQPGRLALRYGGPAALLGLAYLWSRTTLDDPHLFSGLTALNAVLTAWVVLSVTASGPASTVLGSWPLRTLGRFAYTAYLVHWPIFLLLDEPRFKLDENVQFVARVGLTLALAVALHYAVEQPWREGLRMPRARVAAILGGAMTAVLVAVMVLPQQPPIGVSLSIGSGSGPGQLDVVVPTGGDGVANVALVGDALATSLVPGVANWNESRPNSQVRLATHITDGCPPGRPRPGADRGCDRRRERRLPRLGAAPAPPGRRRQARRRSSWSPASTSWASATSTAPGTTSATPPTTTGWPTSSTSWPPRWPTPASRCCGRRSPTCGWAAPTATGAGTTRTTPPGSTATTSSCGRPPPATTTSRSSTWRPGRRTWPPAASSAPTSARTARPSPSGAPTAPCPG